MASHQDRTDLNPFDDTNVIFDRDEENKLNEDENEQLLNSAQPKHQKKPKIHSRSNTSEIENNYLPKATETFHEYKRGSEDENYSHGEDKDDAVKSDSSSGTEGSSAVKQSPEHEDQQYAHVDFDSKRYTSRLSFKGNRLVYFTSAFVSLFVSLFGYEQGVCSGILMFDTFQSYFDRPSSTQIGLVISILEIGAMVSSLLVSKISDVLGRKRTILLGTFIFMIGGTLQSFAINLWIFGVGRVLSGIGVGILSTMVPSYQCEISPSEERGKLVCAEFTGNISGYALSVWVDYFSYFIQNIHDARKNPHSFAANLSWRLPLFLQVILAFILFVGGFFIVESPRWLLDEDKDQQGFHVLALLYDSHPDPEKPRKEFLMIKSSIIHERVTTPKSERTWKHLLTAYRLRVLIACSSLAFAQLNGINIISYYAPMVFGEAGYNDSNALLMTGINAIVYLLSTIPPWFLVDRWGRKPILISGGFSMAICLSLIAWFMHLDKSFTPTMVALLVIIYNASFGYSWGPIGFLYPPEVYPLSVRSKGVSLSTAANWLSNYIVGQATPIAQERIGWAMYIFPASSCVISAIVVHFFYPETKGAELEDIDSLFDEFYNHGHANINDYFTLDNDFNADAYEFELEGFDENENENERRNYTTDPIFEVENDSEDDADFTHRRML